MSNLIPTIKKDTKKAIDSGFDTLPNLPSWFDDFLGKRSGSEFMTNFNTGITLPAVNVIDSDDAFIIEMAVPGFKKSDFDIKLDNYVLTIGMESKSENKNFNYTRREFEYSSFRRTFTIPDSVDIDGISAAYNDGILKVLLPKRDEAKKKPLKSIKIS